MSCPDPPSWMNLLLRLMKALSTGSLQLVSPFLPELVQLQRATLSKVKLFLGGSHPMVIRSVLLVTAQKSHSSSMAFWGLAVAVVGSTS